MSEAIILCKIKTKHFITFQNLPRYFSIKKNKTHNLFNVDFTSIKLSKYQIDKNLLQKLIPSKQMALCLQFYKRIITEI